MTKKDKHDTLEPSCSACCHTPTKWYKERLFIIGISVAILFALSYYIDILNPFFDSFSFYLLLMWIPILVGFLVGGIIDYFVPKEYIEKYLSRHNKKTIIYAILFGFLMTACCHGILAIAIELYKKANEEGEPFEVVILDLTIPGGMGGKEAVQKLREINPDLKAVVSSGYSNNPIMSEYKSYGFNDVVAKP